MTRASTHAALLLASLAAFSGAARAQAQAPGSGAADSTSVRVRASHRVEVIAPGEHVDTVIDRMRASSAQTQATETQPATERLPVRPAELQRTGDRSQADRQRQNVHGSGGPGAAPGGPNGSGPPPDRR